MENNNERAEKEALVRRLIEILEHASMKEVRLVLISAHGITKK